MESCCRPPTASQFLVKAAALTEGSSGSHSNAIFVKGGVSHVGTREPVIIADGEGPERKLHVRDFFLEAETVTNERFADFVAATGHVTDSERLGYSGVFYSLLSKDMKARHAPQRKSWWVKIDHANWRHPEGPDSNVDGRLDHPVTHVSLNDATAFARWVGGRLPTEVEWEHAARGGARRSRYPWGNEEPSDEATYCNIWQGTFPHTNTLRDGYLGTAPARSFSANEAGFYNLVGNVWEWNADVFRVRSLSRASKHRNGLAKASAEQLLKGGSFLCHASYCFRYRIAARMGLPPDSASSNVGFRIAYDLI